MRLALLLEPHGAPGTSVFEAKDVSQDLRFFYQRLTKLPRGGAGKAMRNCNEQKRKKNTTSRVCGPTCAANGMRRWQHHAGTL